MVPGVDDVLHLRNFGLWTLLWSTSTSTKILIFYKSKNECMFSALIFLWGKSEISLSQTASIITWEFWVRLWELVWGSGVYGSARNQNTVYKLFVWVNYWFSHFTFLPWVKCWRFKSKCLKAVSALSLMLASKIFIWEHFQDLAACLKIYKGNIMGCGMPYTESY